MEGRFDCDMRGIITLRATPLGERRFAFFGLGPRCPRSIMKASGPLPLLRGVHADQLKSGSRMPWDVDMKMNAGDWVEVRSKDEILATLDKNGRCEDLPFMPQMFDYCGRRFRVHSRAYKTCDTVSGHYVGRRLPEGVHLSIRCDGRSYGGCQAGCLIFWKSIW